MRQGLYTPPVLYCQVHSEMWNHVLLSWLLVAGLKSVACIKCYECNTRQDSQCSDPFNNASRSSLQPVECEFRSRSILELILAEMTTLGQAPAVQVPPQGPVIFPSDLTTCQKIDIQSERITGRGCSGPVMDVVPPCDVIKLITTSELVLEFCAVCETDACNAAIRPTSLGVVISLLLVNQMIP